MATRFCYRCGTPAMETATYCYRCGASLVTPTNTRSIPIVSVPAGTEIPPQYTVVSTSAEEK